MHNKAISQACQSKVVHQEQVSIAGEKVSEWNVLLERSTREWTVLRKSQKGEKNLLLIDMHVARHHPITGHNVQKEMQSLRLAIG